MGPAPGLSSNLCAVRQGVQDQMNSELSGSSQHQAKGLHLQIGKKKKNKSVMLGPSELDPHSLLRERSALNLTERTRYWATLVVQWSVYDEAKGTPTLWDMLVLILKINVSSSLMVITCPSQPLIVPPTPLHLSRQEFCSIVVGKPELHLAHKSLKILLFDKVGTICPKLALYCRVWPRMRGTLSRCSGM